MPFFITLRFLLFSFFLSHFFLFSSYPPPSISSSWSYSLSSLSSLFYFPCYPPPPLPLTPYSSLSFVLPHFHFLQPESRRKPLWNKSLRKSPSAVADWTGSEVSFASGNPSRGSPTDIGSLRGDEAEARRRFLYRSLSTLWCTSSAVAPGLLRYVTPGQYVIISVAASSVCHLFIFSYWLLGIG